MSVEDKANAEYGLRSREYLQLTPAVSFRQSPAWWLGHRRALNQSISPPLELMHRAAWQLAQLHRELFQPVLGMTAEV